MNITMFYCSNCNTYNLDKNLHSCKSELKNVSHSTFFIYPHDNKNTVFLLKEGEE